VKDEERRCGMKRMAIVVAGCVVVGVAYAQVEITSFGHNGQLTWTAPTNSVCTVQWLADPTAATNWQENWLQLCEIGMTNNGMTAAVPMFYRVVSWTNGLFWPMPIGRTYTYAVSNALGQTWTNQATVQGALILPRGPAERYYLVVRSETYEGTEPVGYSHGGSDFFRSTDVATYCLQGPFENIAWQNAAIGTTWTNTILGSAGGTDVCSVVSNEVVSVPAGTFGCIKYTINRTTSSNPDSRRFDWISPRLGLVKEVFYDISDTNAAPVVSELRSWMDR
jgi:hypothetical protein